MAKKRPRRIKAHDFPGWPSARTKCVVCGEDIIYDVYTMKGGQKVRRTPPRTHSGMCAYRLKFVRAEKKIQKYNKQRGLSPHNQPKPKEAVMPTNEETTTLKRLNASTTMWHNYERYTQNLDAMNKVGKASDIKVTEAEDGQYEVSHKKDVIYRTGNKRSLLFFVLLQTVSIAADGELTTETVDAPSTAKPKAKAKPKPKAKAKAKPKAKGRKAKQAEATA